MKLKFQTPIIKSVMGCLVGLVFCGPVLNAQPTKPPQPPFLVPDSETLQWSVQVQGLPGKEKNQASESIVNNPGAPETSFTPSSGSLRRILKQVDATRSNGLLKKIHTWANGTKTEKWWQGPYLLLEEPNDDDIFITSWGNLCRTQELYEDYGNSNFPELNWVRDSTFLEWVTLGDRLVAVYGQIKGQGGLTDLLKALEGEDPLKAKPQDTDTEPQTSRDAYGRLAWIDAQTKRPIAMESGRRRYTYVFSDGEITPLALPSEFQQALERYRIATTAPTMRVKP